MSSAQVALMLFGAFFVLLLLRVPVAFALGLACVPVFFIDERLTPFLLLNEMLKSYNSFLLLAIPFFLLAANLMNAAGITEKLIRLARTVVGHLPGGLGHVNVVVSWLPCRCRRVSADATTRLRGEATWQSSVTEGTC